jgi:hypothetical protein
VTITSYPNYIKIKEGDGNVNFYGSSVDAFGRVRTSNPITLFDSKNLYADNGYFSTSTSGTATVSHLVNESTVKMEVGTASGDKIYRESRRVFSYQPGKSLLIMSTFVFNQAKSNLRQRVGYFSTENGIFLEQDGTTINLVKRSYVSGSVVDTKVPKAEWNGDKLDGYGKSEATLDLSKSQIFWIDIEWLGVGSVRCGLVIDGKLIICHTFHNANITDSVYMTTPNLPLRMEIENTGTTASSSFMKAICATIISEGGYERKVEPSVVRMTAATTVGTSFEPLMTIRLASDRLDAIILPNKYAVQPLTNATYEIALIKNVTSLTGDSYDTSTFANFDFDISATALSGGTILRAEYLGSSNQSSPQLDVNGSYNWALQLGRTIAGVSDTLTVAARVTSGTGDIVGTFEIYDLTK